MNERFDAAIVGGGMWGLNAAYHLVRRDPRLRIVVLERNAALADETTRQSAGQIGQLRSCPVMARGVAYALELYGAFRERTGRDPAFVRTGSLHLALAPERREAFLRLVDRAAAIGVRAWPVGPDALGDLAPAVDAGKVLASLYVPDDGVVDARRCALALADVARDLGVEIRCGVDVRGLLVDRGRVSGLRLADGSLAAPCVLLTAGPWTRILAEEVGLRLPTWPIRLQQCRTVADPHLSSRHPVLRIPDQSSYVRPEKGGYLYGRFDQGATAVDRLDRATRTSDVTPCVELVEDMRRGLADVLPLPARLPVDEYRQGMVTCTPDGRYLLGPIPHLAGLWLATGCGGMGIAGSAAVGKWLADWVVDGSPGEDLAQFDPLRFHYAAHESDRLREDCRRVFANYYSLAGGGTTYSLGDPAATN